jgi:hypothetical protein
LFQFLGRSGTVEGEVLVFNLGVVLNIAVVTPQAPADNCAGIGVGAPALAMETRLLALFAQAGEVDLYCGGLDCRHLSLRFVFVFGAGAKFNRAIAVIIALHRETADAVATVAALPIVARNIAIMAMAHLGVLFLSVHSKKRVYAAAGASRCAASDNLPGVAPELF